MANAEKRKVLSYEVTGTVLTISEGDQTLRSYDRSEWSNEITDKLLDLGFSTKIVNFGAGSKSTAEKLAAMDAGVARLEEGEWEKEREGGARVVSAEIEALAELKGISVAAVQKALRDYTAEQRAKILSKPQVQKIAARIKAEREEGDADLSDMLEE